MTEPSAQLTIYALALFTPYRRRSTSNVPWFNQRQHSEFFPRTILARDWASSTKCNKCRRAKQLLKHTNPVGQKAAPVAEDETAFFVAS